MKKLLNRLLTYLRLKKNNKLNGSIYLPNIRSGTKLISYDLIPVMPMSMRYGFMYDNDIEKEDTYIAIKSSDVYGLTKSKKYSIGKIKFTTNAPALSGFLFKNDSGERIYFTEEQRKEYFITLVEWRKQKLKKL